MREALKASGIKQNELAKRLDITQASVSNTLNRQHIGADALIAVMDAMGFTVMVGRKENGSFVPMWELEREE